MLKDQGIDEGYWQLILNFGFKALNAPSADETKLVPALLGVVNHLGMQRVERPVPGLTVDAATGDSVGSLAELREEELRKISASPRTGPPGA
jgi:hypothetical protein